MEIIFATKNKGKLKEVSHILNNSKFILSSLLDFENIPEIVEDGNTFEENAFIKAKAIFNLFRVPVIADDSGLVVEQLGGLPGVMSARFAGDNATDEDNNNLLLKRLNNYPEPHNARFVCSAVFYDGETTFKSEGEVKGNIIKSPRGSKGFGYDPLFIPEGFNITAAEMDLSLKNNISHRSKAFKKLKILLEQLMEKK